MRYSTCSILAVGTITLCSCDRAPPLTTAEDQRIDRSKVQESADQDRTDRAQTHKQALAVELQQGRLSNTTPITVAGVRAIPQNNPRPHFPPEIQIPPSSGNILAHPPRAGK